MIGLLPAFALMTTLAVLALLWPVFRRPRATPRESFEIEVYRDQLAEIERDRERGIIGTEEARAGRVEIERRLLRVAGSGDEAPAAPTSGQRLPIIVAALLIPTLAAGLYAALGSPQTPDEPLALRQDREPQPTGQPNVQEMVASLEARLAATPDDLDGWLMLARSRAVLGNTTGSVEAYRQALALAADDPRAIGGLGEALTAAADGIVTPEAKSEFVRLAEVDPQDPRAAFYLGWADSQAGDEQAALKRWSDLLAATPADAPWKPRVVEAVRGAATALNLDADKVLAAIPVPPAKPQPTAADVANAADMSPEARTAMIRGMVDKLQARMDADGSDVEGWLRLAQSREVLGEPDRALATFQQALKLHPEDPELLKGYGRILLGPVREDTGLPEVTDLANDQFSKAAKLKPDDPESLWYLGVRALQDGRTGDARSAWQKVLARIDPSQPGYQDLKSRLDSLGG
ncbi:MAG: c-type cytochrome biogenesis protein CcmI [Geminicoccaceae bacterium]